MGLVELGGSRPLSFGRLIHRDAVSADRNRMQLPRLSLRALAVGLVAMLALDLVSGFVVLLLWPGSPRTSADIAAVVAQPAYMTVAFMLGTMTTAVGGGICARLAATLPYWNAAAFGVLGVAVGLLLSDSTQPWWFTALGSLVTVPAALYGARVGLQRGR